MDQTWKNNAGSQDPINNQPPKTKWRRYRFQTHSIDDPRPLIFDPRYPWWVSGYDGFMTEYATIIAYLPEDDPLAKYWDDAYEVEYTEEEAITFSSRFPKPDYFQEGNDGR